MSTPSEPLAPAPPGIFSVAPGYSFTVRNPETLVQDRQVQMFYSEVDRANPDDLVQRGIGSVTSWVLIALGWIVVGVYWAGSMFLLVRTISRLF